MENHQDCKMKFRNQLAVNLVKLLAPPYSYPNSEINIVDTAFDLADRTAARIQRDIDIEHQKTADQSLAEIRACKAAGSAEANQAEAPVNRPAEVAAGQPEDLRFFLITNEGQLFPKRDESFEDFITRALFDLEGK